MLNYIKIEVAIWLSQFFFVPLHQVKQKKLIELNMKKILCSSPLCHGIRLDSGVSDFFSALNTDVQYRPIVFPPMDAQKRNNNIVMKLTNTNPMNERIKFTECKKR